MDKNVTHEMCFGKDAQGRLISVVESCKKVKYGNYLLATFGRVEGNYNNDKKFNIYNKGNNNYNKCNDYNSAKMLVCI